MKRGRITIVSCKLVYGIFPPLSIGKFKTSFKNNFFSLTKERSIEKETRKRHISRYRRLDSSCYFTRIEEKEKL